MGGGEGGKVRREGKEEAKREGGEGEVWWPMDEPAYPTSRTHLENHGLQLASTWDPDADTDSRTTGAQTRKHARRSIRARKGPMSGEPESVLVRQRVFVCANNVGLQDIHPLRLNSGARSERKQSSKNRGKQQSGEKSEVKKRVSK